VAAVGPKKNSAEKGALEKHVEKCNSITLWQLRLALPMARCPLPSVLFVLVEKPEAF